MVIEVIELIMVIKVIKVIMRLLSQAPQDQPLSLRLVSPPIACLLRARGLGRPARAARRLAQRVLVRRSRARSGIAARRSGCGQAALAVCLAARTPRTACQRSPVHFDRLHAALASASRLLALLSYCCSSLPPPLSLPLPRALEREGLSLVFQSLRPAMLSPLQPQGPRPRNSPRILARPSPVSLPLKKSPRLSLPFPDRWEP
ncbi:hypothetical protein M432DRAFT_637518 [Thermoascus aurantiacus ATCC 26904]